MKFKKFFALFYIIVTFLTVFHQHSDLKQHNDCKVCVVKSNIVDADTPTQHLYLSDIQIFSDSILKGLIQLDQKNTYSYKKSRAPPQIS